MLSACPVCVAGAAEAVLVWRTAEAPIYQLCKAGVEPAVDDFAELDVVACHACGHLYNRAFRDALGERMYRGDLLSNVPVHVSMTRGLEDVVAWIGAGLVVGKRVVEVGAGSGYLARIIARTATEVLVFEPSRGLDAGAIPEANVRVVHDRFAPERVDGPVDLVVCRQVLEHVADARGFLAAMAACVHSHGRLYVEVPRAEYIEERAALFDLHCAHVQYFREANFVLLAARAGLAVERMWRLKDGHDFGALLRKDRVTVPTPRRGPDPGLGAALARRRDAVASIVRALPEPVALYGATWHGVGFLGALGEFRRFAFALDDNDDYAGYALFGRTQTVPVMPPARERLRNVGAVLITAYLHDRVIGERVRALGFEGPLWSIGAAPGDALTSI